ncbi:MAG: hypothetical protein KUA37_01995 [Desulfomicrobium sp.]|nr:hypothetical protein [Pseudomonadota bacterium]MBV1710763.1 hypothetical protein [Desulfomicrobium sp.]MBU4570371.1 hypothetical protein [Pseudomonadota bacterium]MBU4593292.1 hypothetical protein [Pseudomonadota bacterium]MBV1721554.1 hypothetical protein [Desulfomicrobium sp.]
MWTSIIRLFTAVRLSWAPWALLALCILVFTLYGQVQSLRLAAARSAFHAEAAAHNATRTVLARTQADIGALSVALAASERATASVQGSLKQALAREAEAADAATARKRILDAMHSRPRTETEKQEVVDDETRRAAAARINRTL